MKFKHPYTHVAQCFYKENWSVTLVIGFEQSVFVCNKTTAHHPSKTLITLAIYSIFTLKYPLIVFVVSNLSIRINTIITWIMLEPSLYSSFWILAFIHNPTQIHIIWIHTIVIHLISSCLAPLSVACLRGVPVLWTIFYYGVSQLGQ